MASSTPSSPPSSGSFEALVAKSKEFESRCVKFPTDANRVSAIVARAAATPGLSPTEKHAEEARVRRQIEEDARGTRILVHPRVWGLAQDFLALKQRHGTPEEQAVYRGMDPRSLVRRLITHRPLTFLNSNDYTVLRDGTRIPSAALLWDAVGTQPTPAPTPASLLWDAFSSVWRQAQPAAHSVAGQGAPRLLLSEYLSYDEMQIAALLGTSTPTLFVNSGARGNCARPQDPGTFESHGVYLGLVGPRFERPGRMEDEWVVVRGGLGRYFTELPLRKGEQQEVTALRVRMWMRALGVPEEHWWETVVPAKKRLARDSADVDAAFTESFVPIRGDKSERINIALYKARIRLTAETALAEANARAQAAGRKAYVHVVGLGLGVWEVLPQQSQWYADTFAEVIETLRLPHVGVVDFSWIARATSCGKYGPGTVTDCANGNRIRIEFSRRDPAELLKRGEGGEEVLLVATYAWDGNAYPGNEYWTGSLSGSGDPAAICCSTLGELQNPLINDFTQNIELLELN